LDCLHVLGTQSLERTKLCFAYNAAKEIFKLELLEESGVLSTAAIPGMLPHDDVGNSLALAFRSSPLVARMICKSETLREVIPELELVAGATIGTVSLGLANGLEIATVGHWGECLVSVPSRGSHIVSFDVPPQHQAQAAPARSYPLHSLLGSMRGLEIAEETCITINSIGMIAIQHQVLERHIGDGSPNFVDFIICCLEDEDDDDDDDDDDEEQENDSGDADRTQDQTVSPEQSQRKASQPSFSLSRSQSSTSSSTPGDTGASTLPPKRPLYNQEDHDEDNDNDDDGDDEEEDSHLPLASAAPLFGTVVADPSNGSNALSSPRVGDRSVRRRTSQRTFGRRDRRQRLWDNSNSNSNQHGDEESEASRNLLDDSEDDKHHNNNNNNNNNNDDDDDRYMDEFSQPLDVTDTAETCVEHDRKECSSPEIVYGRQH
jgi:Repair protein Rad1/Rec1/Rad17